MKKPLRNKKATKVSMDVFIECLAHEVRSVVKQKDLDYLVEGLAEYSHPELLDRWIEDPDGEFEIWLWWGTKDENKKPELAVGWALDRIRSFTFDQVFLKEIEQELEFYTEDENATKEELQRSSKRMKVLAEVLDSISKKAKEASDELNRLKEV